MNDIVAHVWDQLSKNEFFEGGFYLALISAVGFKLKSVPTYLYSRIRRHFVYEITIEQSSKLYTTISQWITDNHPKKLRNVEAILDTEITSNDEYNNSPEFYKKSELKLFYRHYNDSIFLIRGGKVISIKKGREKLENAKDFKTAFMGRITMSGFLAKKQIQSIITESLDYLPIKSDNYIQKYTYGYHWDEKIEYINKTVDKFFFDKKQEIIDAVEKFESEKSIYIKNGWDYKMNMLFFGGGGLGKTSFVKALAHHTKRKLWYINIASMENSSLLNAFSQIEPNSIILFDDIDIGMAKRDSKMMDQGVSLSTLFSIFQGSLTKENIVLIATTNFIDKLDPVLIRDGRIDLKVEFKSANKNNIENYLHFIFDEKITLPDIDFKGITIPTIENYCKLYNDINIVSEKIINYKGN